jgi:hypothetical protein
MIKKVEKMKSMFEKENEEMEEKKRVLMENNIVLEGKNESEDERKKNKRNRNII